jgi:V/A-type H+-transporting ATPase subunit E
MQNKLQELTEKLYNEGLSKGQSDAEDIVNAAKIEAKKIIDSAQRQAKTIGENANKLAAETKKNADAEITLASRQVIAQVKQNIEELITTEIIAPTTKAAMKDVDFIQSLIETTVEKFSIGSQSSNDLCVLLPEANQKDFDIFIKKAANDKLKSGNLEFKFSKHINSGFQILVKDDGYYISFTEQDFMNLFCEYVRPKTQELLFAETPASLEKKEKTKYVKLAAEAEQAAAENHNETEEGVEEISGKEKKPKAKKTPKKEEPIQKDGPSLFGE